MTQEEKELLLKDLSVRLPYGVKIELMPITRGKCATLTPAILGDYYISDDVNYLPYLRPMSSMTKEEKEELLNLLFDKEAKYFYIDEEGLIDGKTSYLMKEGLNYPSFCPINIVLYTDWLNAHHFDYCGLIEKNLALDCTGNRVMSR